MKLQQTDEQELEKSKSLELAFGFRTIVQVRFVERWNTVSSPFIIAPVKAPTSWTSRLDVGTSPTLQAQKWLFSLSAHSKQARFLQAEAGNRAQSDNVFCAMGEF